jgi:hypothetical protein
VDAQEKGHKRRIIAFAPAQSAEETTAPPGTGRPAVRSEVQSGRELDRGLFHDVVVEPADQRR